MKTSTFALKKFFQQIASIDTARDFITAAIYDNFLTIVGGNSSNRKPTDLAQKYDHDADKWETFPLLSQATGGGILVSF